MRLILLALSLGYLASAVDGQPVGERKAPWRWSSEERLAARFDPALSAKRSRDHAASQSRPFSRRDFVDGRVSPELFMPIELFTALLTGVEGDISSRDAYRETLRERMIAFGFDDKTFWHDLEAAVPDYLELATHYATIMREPNAASQAAEVAALQPELCYSRSVALTKAQSFFGSEEFNRFMYTVVAPDLTIVAADADGNARGHLLFLARGCR